MTLALMLSGRCPTQPASAARFLAFRAGSFLLVSRSIGAGYLVPRGLFPDIRVWPALLLTAALAPTDDRGMDSPVIKGTSDLASICPEIRSERERERGRERERERER
jgi:hypothetical protein